MATGLDGTTRSTMRGAFAILVRFHSCLIFLVASLGFCLPLGAQVASINKGYSILIDRGLQVGGVVAQTVDQFHLSTMQAGGFTIPQWAWTSDVSQLGAAPGAPWSRWLDYTVENDLTPAEQSYKNNLVQLQIGDEQDLVNNAAIRAATTSWFNNNRAKFPGAILYTNQGAGSGTASGATSMANWIAEAQPDMISFDWYPFTYNPTFDPSFPNRQWNWYWFRVA